MNWLVKLAWMLFAVVQVQSGIIPEESSKQEKTYAQQPNYLHQATVFQSNQNYNLGTQQQSNANIYGNAALQNPQSSAIAPAMAFQQISVNQQSQQPFSRTQQGYFSNPLNVKNIQGEHISNQPQNLQYKTNLNTAPTTSLNNKQLSYAGTQTQQLQGAFQNVPATYEQINYSSQSSTNSREVYNRYQNEDIQHKDNNSKKNNENTEDVKRIYPFPASDLVNTKSKSNRKIPLVLITIQKNKNSFITDKSKTNINKQNSDSTKEGYGSEITNRNVPDSSEKVISKPALNHVTASVSSIQNNYARGSAGVQNNTELYLGNTQQQYYSQTPVSLNERQISQETINQRNNEQQTLYRYPVLAGKKVESSEWKPVDKYGIRFSDNRNINYGVPQLSPNQQNYFAQNQDRSFSHNPAYTQNSNSVQTARQNTANNYDINSGSQQYNQNIQNTDSNTPKIDSNQGTLNKPNYEVTSTYVHQAKINFEANPSYNIASRNNQPNAGSQNYFVSNNIEGLKGGRSQQNTDQRAQVSVPQIQTNFRNEQLSVQGDNNRNFAHVNQDQKQSNSYQTDKDRPEFSYGVNDNQRQSLTVGKTVQFASNLNADSNYKQAAVQNVQSKFASSNLPALQANVNQNIASQNQGNNYLGARNNQAFFSNNAQTHFGQSSPSSSSRAVVNNTQVYPTVASKNTQNFEQQSHTPNNYNAQTQANNFGRSFVSQNPISVPVEGNKNTGISQSSSSGSNQQLSNQNYVKPFQQTVEHFSNNGRTQQNAYSTASINNQQNNPTQNIYYRNSVKTTSQSTQNYIQNQGQNQNIRPEIPNHSYGSNKDNRYNIFQNNQKFDASNNRQSSSEYRTGNAESNSQINQEPVKSEGSSFPFKQNALPGSNAEKQSVATNYGFNTNRDTIRYDNDQNFQTSTNSESNVNRDRNANYENIQNRGANILQGNNYGTNQPINQQNVFDATNRNPKPESYEKVTSSNSNYGSTLNNYQNTNFGSSESQDSVVGTKPDEKTTNNEQQIYTGASYNKLNENRNSEDQFLHNSNDDTIKQESHDEDSDSGPEALLLVLVSAKKSALENHADEEKDDINEGYESAPEELVELLNDETNRKMIIESYQEATNAAYREQEKNKDDEDLEEKLEDEENEKY